MYRVPRYLFPVQLKRLPSRLEVLGALRRMKGRLSTFVQKTNPPHNSLGVLCAETSHET